MSCEGSMTFGESEHPGGLRLTDRAARLAGLSPEMKLLDIGCGNGESLGHLSAKFGIIPYGIDISDEAIECARQKSNPHRAQLSVGSAQSLPYEDSFFDAALCECVFSILDSFCGALAEIRRVLSPNGILIASDICKRSELDGIQERFKRAGFDILAFEEHRAALVTYAAEAYESGALSSRPAMAAETARFVYSQSTYYLIVCQRIY
jgi:ubiquinone/menaquinone biosynthesis C-methylase UbiE